VLIALASAVVGWLVAVLPCHEDEGGRCLATMPIQVGVTDVTVFSRISDGAF
jgi:hypothetical protein